MTSPRTMTLQRLFLLLGLALVGGVPTAHGERASISGLVVAERPSCTLAPFTPCASNLLQGETNDWIAIPGVLVRAIGRGKVIDRARTNDNGEYTLRLPPGRYKLQALTASKRITVGDDDQSDLILEIKPGKGRTPPRRDRRDRTGG